MSCSEETVAKWRFTIGSLFPLIAGIALSVRLFYLAESPLVSNPFMAAYIYLGSFFLFGGSIGGFFGELRRGNLWGYLVGFMIGGLAMSTCLCGAGGYLAL
jgi:hypothetical protein